MRKVKSFRPDTTEQPSLSLLNERGAVPALLDVSQTAQYLGVSESYLNKARCEGSPGGRTPAPPFVRVGGRVLYRRSDLDIWVAELVPQRVI